MLDKPETERRVRRAPRGLAGSSCRACTVRENHATCEHRVGTTTPSPVSVTPTLLTCFRSLVNSSRGGQTAQHKSAPPRPAKRVPCRHDPGDQPNYSSYPWTRVGLKQHFERPSYIAGLCVPPHTPPAAISHLPTPASNPHDSPPVWTPVRLETRHACRGVQWGPLLLLLLSPQFTPDLGEENRVTAAWTARLGSGCRIP